MFICLSTDNSKLESIGDLEILTTFHKSLNSLRHTAFITEAYLFYLREG
jgi:hypothetical protein